MVMAKETMNVKKNRAGAAVQKNNTRIVVIRMLIMVAVDVLGISTLLSIRREAIVELAFVNHWLLPLTIVFGVGALLAAAYLTLTLVKKIDTSSHPVTPAMLFCIALFCFITCLVYKSAFGSVMIAASAVATALFLVYCLYMHIFYR